MISADGVAMVGLYAPVGASDQSASRSVAGKVFAECRDTGFAG